MAKYEEKIIVVSGSITDCAIQFSGNTNTGLFSNGSNLVNLSANGTNVLQCSSTGITVTGLISATTATITSFAGTAGVVHNDSSGNLSSSLVVNADISASAAIANSKLAGNPSSSNTANTIVLRDGSGNSSHGTLTSNSVIVSGITYPTPGTLTDGTYAVTSASNVLSFLSISPYQRIYGSSGYNTSGGYTYTTSGTVNTYTRASANGSLADINSGMTNTATGLTVLTAGIYVVIVQISGRTASWAQRMRISTAQNTTVSPFSNILGDVGGLGLSTFYMSAAQVDVFNCAVNDTLSIYMSSDTASVNFTILTWNIIAYRI